MECKQEIKYLESRICTRADLETERAENLLKGVTPPTYPHFLSVCRVRPQGSRVKISHGLNALWRSYKNFKN